MLVRLVPSLARLQNAEPEPAVPYAKGFLTTTNPADALSPFADFPASAGYTASLLRRFRAGGEEGLSSCSASPCHRAVPSKTAEVLHRLSPPAMLHTACARKASARPSGQGTLEAITASLALRPGDSLTTLNRWHCHQASGHQFPSSLLFKLRGLGLLPRRDSHLLAISAFAGRTFIDTHPIRRSVNVLNGRLSPLV